MRTMSGAVSIDDSSLNIAMIDVLPVSYTHLDVYKRQVRKMNGIRNRANEIVMQEIVYG